MADRERLQRLLGGAQLDPLRRRLRGRYERGVEDGVVTLGKLTPLERAALCGLLGRRPGEGGSLRFSIEDLDIALRDGGLADSLREALCLLDGPIINRTAQRADVLARWERVAALDIEPRLAALLADARAIGMLKRVSGGDSEVATRLCQAASRVLARLPVPAQARSQLAAEALGDAHGLDPGRPVARLVLSALRRRTADDEEAESEETVRETWAASGVLVNELARPALFLNLPRALAMPGEPAYLSLRTLLRYPPQWELKGRLVFVCENPNLVAIAADALGPRCAPLVCTDGMPAAAQRALLHQLTGAGAMLRYHGDFDWPGIAIGNFVMRQFGATPWRFSASDYATAAIGIRDGRPAGDASVVAEWDATLSAAMATEGWAIDEEAVAAELLRDLSQNTTF